MLKAVLRFFFPRKQWVSSSARDEIRPSLRTDGQNLSLHLLSVLSSTRRDKTHLWKEMSALNEEIKTSLQADAY